MRAFVEHDRKYVYHAAQMDPWFSARYLCQKSGRWWMKCSIQIRIGLDFKSVLTWFSLPSPSLAWILVVVRTAGLEQKIAGQPGD